jgi:hypothetical protein
LRRKTNVAGEVTESAMDRRGSLSAGLLQTSSMEMNAAEDATTGNSIATREVAENAMDRRDSLSGGLLKYVNFKYCND